MPPDRVLIVGRSPHVLLDAVAILRTAGYSADATNQFDTVLDDYDVDHLDMLVFGGMVPPDTREHLRREISARNVGVRFVQGLAGIAGVIAAQVEALASSPADAVYDADQRVLVLRLARAERATIEAWWGTSFTPPEPTSTSQLIFDEELPAGEHRVPLPDEVPDVASFVAVRIGSSRRVLTIGEMPKAVMAMAPKSTTDRRLPGVRPVTTVEGSPR